MSHSFDLGVGVVNFLLGEMHSFLFFLGGDATHSFWERAVRPGQVEMAPLTPNDSLPNWRRKCIFPCERTSGTTLFIIPSVTTFVWVGFESLEHVRLFSYLGRLDGKNGEIEKWCFFLLCSLRANISINMLGELGDGSGSL